MISAAYDTEPKVISFSNEVDNVLNEIRKVLIEKNRKYGDSALNPIRVFSKASPVEQILVRLDDKLKRLSNQQIDEDEDTVLDILGYLILLKIAKNRT